MKTKSIIKKEKKYMRRLDQNIYVNRNDTYVNYTYS